MTSKSLKAKIFRIKVERGKAGLFYATSPDLQGLLVAEPNPEAFETSIPAAITDLYAACGVKVVVTRAEDDHQEEAWVAVPAELARRALEAMQAAR